MNLEVKGPKVYLELPFELPDSSIFTMKNLITQTTVSLLAVTVLLIVVALIATRSLSKRPGGLQVITEKLVNMLYGLVEGTMGKHNMKFAPYIGTIFLSSICGTLIGMTQLFRSTTADLSVTAAWALVTTGMVWYNNIKNFGFGTWLKGFTEPIVVMTPMNIVSEIANPISMAFRHFGNVAGGSVLTALIYGALTAASSALFSWLPGIIGEIPFLTAGIPAALSIYFDLFSGFVQALVFSLLTMIYVGGACPPPEELPKKKKKGVK
ncbi:MAG: F0F1 ATP synthase subunit A [Clostridia bacterium]|nr:F0F1 ATP synthase subunit A [Clostridia bacterium]